MFNKILLTAKELFATEGYAYVSTNRIAEQANISIGSLYVYFPNCESIALELYEEASRHAVNEMKQHAIEVMNLPLEESVQKHINWVFEIFEKDQFVLLELVDEIPELRRHSQVFSFDNLIHRTTSTYLEEHFQGVDPQKIEKTVYVIVKGVIGNIRRFLDDKPSFINREELIEELAKFVFSYASQLGPE